MIQNRDAQNAKQNNEMKKTILLFAICMTAQLSAQEVNSTAPTPPNPSREQLPKNTLDAAIGYGHNLTWGSYLQMFAEYQRTLSNNFALFGGIDYRTPSNVAGKIGGEVTFPLKQSQLSLENCYYYTAFIADNTNQFLSQIAIAYNMNYLSAKLGLFNRWFSSIQRETDEALQYIFEPFNVCYSLEGRVRNNLSPWNIGLRISNIDRYELERSSAPTFFLFGFYKLTPELYLNANAALKLTGMGNISAQYYQSYFHAGVTYTW